jgi:capsular polysaccharide biosynthesis protein
MEKPVFSEDELGLMDYLNIIWKRKWLIIIPTLVLVVAVGIYSFLQPKKWEVDAIISPSKFFIQTEQGTFQEVLFSDPEQIASQINQNTYSNLVSSELEIDIREFPRIKAENLRGTKLIRISTREKDPEKAKLILHSLLNHLKKQLDDKVEIEIKGIDTQIKSREIENLRIIEEIKSYQKKLNIVTQRIKEIEKEKDGVKTRIEALEEEQRLNLKKENRNESESLAMLLYSNVIQENLKYHNELIELLSQKKIEEENINLEIENKENRIKQLENEINNLNERKGRMDNTQFIKEPTSSIHPVSPQKTLNILAAVITGITIFTMLAFLIENLEKQRLK